MGFAYGVGGGQMTTEGIVMLFIGALLSVLTGLLLARFARMEKRTEARHKESAEREFLFCEHRLDMGDVVLETARAVKTGTSNGELSTAIEKFEKTHSKVGTFVLKQASAKLAEIK